MRKADIIDNIAKKTGLAKVDALVAVEAFFNEVKDSVKQGEPVFVRGFGSFVIKHRAAKIGQNIKAKEQVNIPAHFVPAFKPAKEFIDDVKKLPVRDMIRKGVKIN